MELSSNHKLQNGKYKIISKIGQGGFGITYQAEWQTEVIGPMGKMNTAIPVAIKEFFFEEYCSRENGNSVVTITSATGKDFFDKFKNKLKKEALILSKLQHPNIVRVLDVFEENNTAYIVMAFVNGESLKDNIRNSGKLDENTALRYIGQLCDALAEIHSNKILHLDIKPSNILIDENDNVQLVDFGISKQYSDLHQETSTTPIGISKGFAPYEQYSGVQEFSPSTDIYAVGATLYNMLTGQIPVESIRLIDEPLKPIHDYNNQISEQTESTIKKAMSMRRSDRQQSVEELKKELINKNTENTIQQTIVDEVDNLQDKVQVKTILEDKEIVNNSTLFSPNKQKEREKKTNGRIQAIKNGFITIAWWKKGLCIVLCGILLLIISINLRYKYDQHNNTKRKKENAIRHIEEVVFRLKGENQVFWVTEGTNTDYHLFEDCSTFHGRTPKKGTVKNAVLYFVDERNVDNYLYYNQYNKLCSICKDRE